VIESSVVGEVVDSRSPDPKPGDVASGQLGWRLHNVAKAKQLMKTIPDVSPTTALGVGRNGADSLFRLLDIGQPKQGETVVVSGAAGAVGMTVCQIANQELSCGRNGGERRKE
jgi:NADPH-dependent curcumin reductase CurA